jgi:hypothetical protein
MKAQRTEILGELSRHGWNAIPVEVYELEWWGDEMWQLESIWSPTGSRAYLTFLVDPQVPHSRTRKKGEAVWAVMASPAKPVRWQSADESFTLSLGPGWEERMPHLFEHLAMLRNQNRGVSAS